MTALKAKADREALAAFDNLPDAAFVRVGVVAALHSVTPVTIWNWARDGKVTPPRKIGPNVTAWNVGELRRNLADTVAA